MTPVMDLRQLEILQAIAETGSFTACGRKLHVSQSAISRQILLLEDELGEPLFLRVGRQVRMTPAAESLVQLGKRVFLDVRETVGAITDRTRELRGTLRLSGGMTVCLYVFPPLLKHLRRVHPQLDVRLTVAMAGHSVQEIRAGRVDAGLLTLPIDDADMVTVPVLREELLLVTMPMPRPVFTIALMISTFSVSITTVGSMLSLAKKLSITRRVADPTSKSTNGSAARSCGATVRRRASGCVGVVTSSSSSRSTGTVTMSASSMGSVRSPASTRPARISWTEWPAIATVRRTSSCGCTRRRCFRSGGKT